MANDTVILLTCRANQTVQLLFGCVLYMGNHWGYKNLSTFLHLFATHHKPSNMNVSGVEVNTLLCQKAHDVKYFEMQFCLLQTVTSVSVCTLLQNISVASSLLKRPLSHFCLHQSSPMTTP